MAKKVLITEQQIIDLHGCLDIDQAKAYTDDKYTAKVFLDGYTKFGSDLLKWFDTQLGVEDEESID